MSEPIAIKPAAAVPTAARGVYPFSVVASPLDHRKSKHHQLWERYKRLLVQRALEPWSDLWCYDARFEVVDAGAQSAAAVEGRADVVRAFAHVLNRCRRIGIRDVTLHQTIDPDVFIVSYRIAVEYGAAERYVSSVIARVRTRDGRIAEIVESVDGEAHTAFLEALEKAA